MTQDPTAGAPTPPPPLRWGMTIPFDGEPLHAVALSNVLQHSFLGYFIRVPPAAGPRRVEWIAMNIQAPLGLS